MGEPIPSHFCRVSEEIAMTPEQWWEAVRKESQFWHAVRGQPA